MRWKSLIDSYLPYHIIRSFLQHLLTFAACWSLYSAFVRSIPPPPDAVAATGWIEEGNTERTSVLDYDDDDNDAVKSTLYQW